MNHHIAGKLIIFIMIVTANALNAQSSGPLTPTMSKVVSIPGSSQSWVNASSAYSSDDNYASFGNLPGSGAYTDYLVLHGFNFNVSSAVIIKGITVTIEISDPNQKTRDYSVRIVHQGNIGDQEKANPAVIPATDEVRTYGSNTDLWGEAWSAKSVNDVDFGVAIAMQRHENGGQTAGRIDNITVTVHYQNITLPVNLLSFTGSKKNNSILLNWVTSSESEIDYYEIERSNDANHFLPLMRTTAKNNNSSSEKYTASDNTPLLGKSWYRLKTVEMNGVEKYSAVIYVNRADESSIKIFPSVANNGERLYLNNTGNKKLKIYFYNSSGTLVATKNTSGDEVILDELGSNKGVLIYKVTDQFEKLRGEGRIVIY